MEEYVSLDKQIEINDVNGRTLNTTVRHILDINHARYDVLPVVRCKDCKYCEHTLKRPNVWMPNETSEDHYNCMRIEDGTKPIVFPDSFCSFGKRGEMRVTL